ncbi:hypothetical protein P43SY_006852 [Pythium insidiosum]|uniref:Uncharacterized protein n=1 Tax=Pythium insidiosum TaxID=114742 RepID=A0AAD5M9D9_PYTIN|nr:hypothetical protein P43SY_006852 [Pythium insidiosum]
MGVILPGFGLAMVSQDDILQVDSPLGCGYRASALVTLALNALKVDDDDNTNQLVASFFSQLHLPSLRRLELKDNLLRRHALVAILQACPNLRILDLEACELQSINPIIEAYTANQCRIESLNLADNHVANRDIIELCRLVCQDSSPASRLREINLEGNPISRSGLHALRVAMRSSSRLRLLVLATSMDPDGTCRSMLNPVANQELPVEPFTVSQRLAFLSVLAMREGVEAMEIINLQRIFSFAASRSVRRVIWR